MAGSSNVPPPDYQPSEFVDGEGCLFLRADVGGWTIWVQHLDAGQPVCGRQPTPLLQQGMDEPATDDGET